MNLNVFSCKDLIRNTHMNNISPASPPKIPALYVLYHYKVMLKSQILIEFSGIYFWLGFFKENLFVYLAFFFCLVVSQLTGGIKVSVSQSEKTIASHRFHGRMI